MYVPSNISIEDFRRSIGEYFMHRVLQGELKISPWVYKETPLVRTTRTFRFPAPLISVGFRIVKTFVYLSQNSPERI